MKGSFGIGRVAGIPVRIHINWFLTAALVTWSLAVGYFPLEYPGWSGPYYWAIAGVTALLFFVSVLLHEMGHALVALNERVPVESITLFIFGGVAHIAHEPETPRSEFRIVIAGPFTSMVLAASFYALYGIGASEMGTALFSEAAPFITAASFYLTEINLILAFFNLVPGFPLDGGRILRAALWRVMKDYNRATRWATTAGYGVAGAFVVGGLALMALGNMVGGLWVVFVGGYLGMVARGARLQLEESSAAEEFEGSQVLPGKEYSVAARDERQEKPAAGTNAMIGHHEELPLEDLVVPVRVEIFPPPDYPR